MLATAVIGAGPGLLFSIMGKLRVGETWELPSTSGETPKTRIVA